MGFGGSQWGLEGSNGSWVALKDVEWFPMRLGSTRWGLETPDGGWRLPMKLRGFQWGLGCWEAPDGEYICDPSLQC